MGIDESSHVIDEFFLLGAAKRDQNAYLPRGVHFFSFCRPTEL